MASHRAERAEDGGCCAVCHPQWGSLAVRELWGNCARAFDVLGRILGGKAPAWMETDCSDRTAQRIACGFASTRDWFTKITEWFAAALCPSRGGQGGLCEVLAREDKARHTVYGVLFVLLNSLIIGRSTGETVSVNVSAD